MWRTFIHHLGSDFLSYDLSQVNVPSGIRNALGILLPLLYGVVAHQIPTGIVIAVGAIVTGFAGLSGTWQKRVRVMIWSVIWVAIASWIGGLTGTVMWVALGFVVLSGGIAGIFVSVSPEMALIGTLATNALIIFSGLALNPKGALGLALEVLAGGTLQILLMLAFVPWQPQSDGTKSLKRVYRTMAQYVAHPSRDADLMVARALVVAEARVGDPAIPAPKRRRLLGLLRQLDSVRSDVVALRSLARFAENSGQNHLSPNLFAHVSLALETLRHKVSTSPESWREPPVPLGTMPYVAPAQALGLGITARVNHLARTLESMALGGDDAAYEWIDPGAIALPKISELYGIIRTNLHLRSAAFRHALRIMGTLAVAIWLYHALVLPRGYWVPLTALVILKADFFSTMGRGIARVAGTALGVILGTAIVVAAGGKDPIGLLAIVLFAFAMYTVLSFNYVVFSVMVSAEIVVLLSFFEKMPPTLAMHDRLVATLIGSGLALMAYLFFPTWQRDQVAITLANLVHSERQYLGAIVRHESPWIARRETRLLRTQAATAVDAAISEPTRPYLIRSSALQMLGYLHDLAEVLMSTEMVYDQVSLADSDPFILTCQAVDGRLKALEAALRTPTPEKTLRALNPLANQVNPGTLYHAVAEQMVEVSRQMVEAFARTTRES